MSQEIQILNYLRRGHAITPLEALWKFGCLRLGARIYDLRRMGYRIDKAMVGNGTRKRWARYRLRGRA